MESGREKEKRVTLAYKIRNHVNGEFFELLEVSEEESSKERKYKFIGEIENPNEQFRNYHPGNKIERLINQVFEAYRGKKPDFLYSAFPIIEIDGEALEFEDVATENFLDLAA